MAQPQVHVFLDALMETPELCPVPMGEAVVYSRRSPDKETHNEDGALVFALSKKAGVIAVADGMGGLPSGEDASSFAIQELARSLENAAIAGTVVRDAILNGFEKANERILESAPGGGTTLSVLEFDNGVVRSYHAGDSLVLVTGQRGKLKWQTLPHSPVGYAVESGQMNEKEALRNPDRHVISNMLGATDMRIEIGPRIPLGARDCVLIASDGLSDNFLTSEIVDAIRSGPLKESAKKLAEQSHHRMTNAPQGKPSKPDDCTFVLFRLQT